MTTTPKVVIALPAYRAERTLAKTVADIPARVKGELILVDDASPDNTAALARTLGIAVHVHPANRGYGGNQKTCYTLALESDADVVVLLHPDYQYEPKAVPLLIAPILAGDADMTFGSRFAGLGDPRAGGMPLYRYVGNRVTTILQNFVLGTRFTEMHSGMRAYTRDCLLSLPFLGYEDDFTFDAELLIDAVTGGMRVVEVPIPTRYTKESSSIAMSPLVKYVTQGLRHAASRARVRGRRGSRRPVSAMSAPTGDSVEAYERMIETAERYVTGGRRIAFLPSSAEVVDVAKHRGWEVVDAEQGVDVVVTAVGPADDLAPRVHSALSMLDRHGLLVVVRRDHAMGPPMGLTELLADVATAGGHVVEAFIDPGGPSTDDPYALVVRPTLGRFDFRGIDQHRE